MNEENILSILSEWKDEFDLTLSRNNSIGIALLNREGDLLFANSFMKSFLQGKARDKFINPGFDRLISIGGDDTLIFEGYLTLGDYSAANASLWAQVYRKANKLLVIGGIDAEQLIEQNRKLHGLNRDVIDLQRELIKKKHTLENTLKRLNNANDGLEELNATKDKFFSIIGHDLKNPFHVILGLSDLLERNADGYSPEKVRLFARKIHDSSQNAYNLLENLLKWARIQRGELKAELAKVEPLELIHEVKDSSQPGADAKNIRLEIRDDGHGWILADTEMLRTILRNLITNAIKYTHPGGKILIGTQRLESHLQFTVSDSGVGIPPEYIDQLFNVDCSLSKPGTANEKGTGLGLILCKEFVEKQGGQIWVESELEKGSDFKFTLPLYQKD
jgi:signal transduction histidine kinase